MTLRTLIWRALVQWRAWRLARANPELARLDRELAARRRAHRSTRSLVARRREIVHRTLAGERAW